MTEDIPKSGPEAIEYALSQLDIDKVEKEHRDVIASGKKTVRSRSVRVLGILQGMRNNNNTPKDFFIRKVPVIPPQFRPFSISGSTFIAGDANELYKDLMEFKRLNRESEEVLGRKGSGEAYLDMYRAVKAVYGFGDSPNPKTQQRDVKGFFKQVTGTSPKLGMYQRKMLSKNQDMVGRGVIIPDADLNMNEIGIPREMGWKTYSPWIMRRLVQSGMSPGQALKAVKDRTTQAEKALHEEMKNRPVVYSRPPAWHKFNIIGGKPHLVDGDSIRINTWVTDGVAGDFNGDDQIGKVLVATRVSGDTDSHKVGSKNLKRYLTLPLDTATVTTMINKNIIPTINTDDFQLGLVDLQDFPKGELLGKKEGRNGPIEFYAVPEGTQVIAYDELRGCPVWSDVACYSIHPDRKVEVVDLSNGRNITTDDDPRAIYGMDPHSADWATMVRGTPTDAKAGGYLIPSLNNVKDNCIGLDSIQTIENRGTTYTLDRDLGYFMGAMIGDGWWDKKLYGHADVRRCYFADLPGDNARRVTSFLENFGMSSSYTTEGKKGEPGRYGDTVKYTFNMVDDSIVHLLNDWCGGPRDENTSGSGNKQLPDFFLLAPLEFREGLLSGLIDTDGTINMTTSHGKDNQFQCSYSSTSIRLVNDVKFLALTMGIRSTVNFAKVTTKGNDCWVCTFSRPDFKEKGVEVVEAMQSGYKREAFYKADTITMNTDTMHYGKAIPVSIYDDLIAWSVNPKRTVDTTGMSATDKDLRLRWSKATTALYAVKNKHNYVARKDVITSIEDLIQEQWDLDTQVITAGTDTLRRILEDGLFTPERCQIIRDAFCAKFPNQGDREVFVKRDKVLARVNKPKRLGKMGPACATGLLDYLTDTPRVDPITKTEAYGVWRERILENDDISWSYIREIHYTDQRETGYDLTVPGPDTFMSIDGTILSNTMTVHVPALPETVKEVQDKLMPDKMLWHVKDKDKTIHNPKHEQVLGLFNASNNPSKGKHTFETAREAEQAIDQGKISLSDEITVLRE